jgi:hypothetical protein
VIARTIDTTEKYNMGIMSEQLCTSTRSRADISRVNIAFGWLKKIPAFPLRTEEPD